MAAVAQVCQQAAERNGCGALSLHGDGAVFNGHVVDANRYFGVKVSHAAVGQVEYHVFEVALAHKVVRTLKVGNGKVVEVAFNLLERNVVNENEVLVLVAERIEA